MRNNIGINICGESLWGLQAAMTAPATFLAVLLQHYGAGKVMIGSIATVETGGVLLTQIAGLYLFTSIRKRQRQLILWHLAAVIPFLFLMSAAAYGGIRLPAPLTRGLILGSFAGYMMAIGVVVAVWSDWTASLFSLDIRGKVMGASLSAAFIAGSLGALLSGWLLSSWRDPRIFAAILAAAGLIAAASMSVFRLIDDPAARTGVDRPPFDTTALLARFRRSLADSNFRLFLAGRVFSVLGFSVLPFIAVYFGSPAGGGLAPGQLVACGAALSVGTALGSFSLGWMGDRRGHKAGVVVGVLAQSGCLFVLLNGQGMASCLAAYFFAGVCTASGWISHYNMLFETCPHDHLAAHITVANLLLGVVAVAAPLLAGAVAERWGLEPLFMGSLAISLIALCWFVMRVKEPRRLARNHG